MITPDLSAREPDRWRQWWLYLLSVAMVLLTVVSVVEYNTGRQPVAAAPLPSVAPAPLPASAAPAPATSAPATSAPADSAVATSAPATEQASSLIDGDVLQLSGSVPTHASGSFTYATKRGTIMGTKGTLRRFRVAVEKGSGEDVDAFADQVVSTLGDDRSWIGNGNLRLQMVGGSDSADFTVYLATRNTAGEMCQRGGTNIRIGGVPYTSCRTPGKAIINLDRYRKSATPYIEAKVPLAIYRNYVINHEVGHELGHHHEGCPKSGGPAPVMVQQTLTLRGCVPYAWPRRNDHSFSGPALSR
ncbi:DUF3152 domain-containing protein [Actinoplanes sp. NPDC051851]|uniref:DUF3152 domain-containing protein n=1 Tax=Actinoplanes sp. NPDC051851 TaxID=3154753 RepID=UPI00343A03D4